MMPIVGFIQCFGQFQKLDLREPEKEHVYVFFCQMPKTKARSGPFQKGADVRSIRRQGHVAVHHFETAH